MKLNPTDLRIRIKGSKVRVIHPERNIGIECDDTLSYKRNESIAVERLNKLRWVVEIIDRSGFGFNNIDDIDINDIESYWEEDIKFVIHKPTGIIYFLTSKYWSLSEHPADYAPILVLAKRYEIDKFNDYVEFIFKKIVKVYLESDIRWDNETKSS